MHLGGPTMIGNGRSLFDFLWREDLRLSFRLIADSNYFEGPFSCTLDKAAEQAELARLREMLREKGIEPPA